jgi:hypothetical protein
MRGKKELAENSWQRYYSNNPLQALPAETKCMGGGVGVGIIKPKFCVK